MTRWSEPSRSTALTGRLPKADRRILDLRFHEELSQAAIPARARCSQMQVSRSLRRVLGELALMAGEDAPELKP